ncbi:polysaccharide biosynthesis C-terminal domain-containing protein [Ferruginibacter yonginensis]|uniref:Polysaccharide biosynthesis C-terminal domain-containing protein n=1 Tax=Ferruginibacter yonginensis TaxID=1310416 RepID=A0ABV8QRP8_9BACT
MGIIQKQALRSTIFLFVGFMIGGLNILVLFPKLTALEINGLTRAFLDVGVVLSTLAGFGSVSMVYKFYPYYNSNLKKNENDLPFVTILMCLAGFIIICFVGYFFKDFISRKLGKAPLFATYFYLVYPITFFMLLFAWLESFAWAFKKSVYSNFLRETLIRFLTTILILLCWFNIIQTSSFITLFCCIYIIPVIILFYVLRKTKSFYFTFKFSKVTRRYWKKMFLYSMFIFGASFLQVASRTMDSFVIIGLKGLEATAIFLLGSYLASLMDLPLRSLISITTPIISESWKEKNYNNIFDIYKKSTITLLVAAIFIFGAVMLNIDSLIKFLGKSYLEVPFIVLIMGLARTIDLGTGVNGQIIATSINWKFDFFTNVLLTIIALPLNFILINNFGIIGGAYATLIATSVYNLVRYLFIYFKYKWQPYGLPHLKIIFLGLIAFIIAHFITVFDNLILDVLIRSFIYTLIFIVILFYSNVSNDINNIILKYWNKIFK